MASTSSHLYLLLVLLLCVFSASSDDVSISLDCGSSENYTDKNSIIWLGDESYMTNGESYEVPSDKSLTSQAMNTLRVFTTRNKNCYLIKVEKGGRILIRASFYYGNYDGKSSPPTFALSFDGNDWARVSTSSDQMVYYETIYVAKTDYLSVCLARTLPDQFPFISALEVRPLASTMYNDVGSNHALFLSRRIAYGSNQTIRYTDDAYDRIWVPATPGNGLETLTSNAISIFTDKGDQPPEEALRHAMSTVNASDSIIFNMKFIPIEVSIYLNMYFSEVTQLDSDQKRSFMVFKDNKPFSDPFSPPYGNFTELYVSNTTVSSNTTFSLVPTANSTLPPLINAMELFFISDSLTDGTDSKDVESLVSLQKEYEVLQDWSGDPCLPSPFTWDWVNCSSDDSPRITALYLSSLSLSGSLPDLSSMDALETIDLSNNSFDGPIPDFLGSLPNLKELNLANNKFTGQIPASLSDKNGLNLEVSGNPLCSTSDKSCQNTGSSPGNSGTRSARSPSAKKKKKNNLPIILGTAIPAFFLIWAIVGIIAIFHFRSKRVARSTITPGQTGGGTEANNAVNVQMTDKYGHEASDQKSYGGHEHENTNNV